MRSRWIPAGFGALAVVASGLGVFPTSPPLTAHADSLTTQFFKGTGGCPSGVYTVPTGVVAVDVTAIGDQGGTGGEYDGHGGGVGGRGASLSARLPVNAGDNLEADVANVGRGGAPTGPDANGGSGGGASAIYGPGGNACGGMNPIMVAGGGGGGGAGDIGGPGGTGGDAGYPNGSSGNNASSNESEAGGGGGGGTSTAGGTGGPGGHGGVFGTGDKGGNGSALSGGGGGAYSGGGGGGGWFGGGGGGGSGGDGGGGGGGGSSGVESTATDVSGSVAPTGTTPSITFTPAVWTTTTTVASSPNPSPTSSSVAYEATVASHSPAAPSAGTVHFVATQGATTVDMGTAAVSGGSALVNYTLGPGVWAVTGTYSGSGDTSFGTTGYTGSTSSAYSQTMGTAPQITVAPVDSVTSYPPGNAHFSVKDSGDPAPTEQWQDLNGGVWTTIWTGPNLDLTCTFCQGPFRVVVSNVLGSVTSHEVNAFVNHAPAMAATVSDVNAPVGGSGTFSAFGTAYPGATARWKVSTDHGATWSDPDPARTTVATSQSANSEYGWQSTLRFNQVLSTDGGTEAHVTFTNTLGSATSNDATLHLLPTCIVPNPTPGHASQCAHADLGNLDLHSVDLSYGDYTGAFFTNDNLTAADFIEANLTSAVLADATLSGATFIGANLTGAYITGDDFSSNQIAGATVTGTVLVPSDMTVYTNDTSATVTWTDPPVTSYGFRSISCAPSSGSSFPLDTPAGGTTVTCSVTGAFAETATGTFTVHVLPAVAPQVTQQPTDATVFWQSLGYATTFTAAASGTPAPTVQWQVSTDGGATFIDIPGAVFGQLFVSNPPFSATGNEYRAVFTNMASTATSNAATLHVLPQPVGVVVGGTQTFGGLPSFTQDAHAPDGETVSGSVTCTSVFGVDGDVAISPSLAPGTYNIDRTTCSGLTLGPDSTDYAIEYDANPFVVSPATITVNVSGTWNPTTGPPRYTETDDAPVSVPPILPPATTIVCSTVNGGSPIAPKPGSYTLDGSSCQYSPALANPDYTVQFAGVTDGFVVTGAVHVAVSGTEVYGGTPTFLDAGDDASQIGVTLSGTLVCAPPAGMPPLPVVNGLVVSGATCSGLTASPPVEIDYVDGPFTVTPAAVVVTAEDASMTYGGTVPSFDAMVIGLVGPDTFASLAGSCSSSIAGATLPAGAYPGAIACSGITSPNYSVTYNAGTLVVHQAPLSVTANDKSMSYGGTVPSFDATVTGLVNSDTFSSLHGTCGDAAASPTLAAGTYTNAITCTGVDATNYSVTYHPGTLTVGQATLSVTANDKSMTYGGTVPSFDATVVGLVNSDTFSSLHGTCGDAAASPTLAAGTYTNAITCTGVDATNYSVTYHPGTLTVGRAALSVTANAKSMTYGGTVPSFDAAVTGLVNSDTFTSLSGTCSSSSAAPTLPAGTYAGAIACSGVNPANYDVTYYPGNLIVNRAALSVAANDKSMTYGGTAPSFDATVTGLQNSDTFSSLHGTCGDAAASPTLGAGTYTGAITCSGVNPANYDITYLAGTLTVGQAPLTVAADNKTMTYGYAVPTLTATISGFVNGQTVSTSGVTGMAACNTTATPSSSYGPYPIICTVGSLSAANYSFPAPNFVKGTLTVGKHGATVGFTGMQFWTTGSSSMTTANVTLAATVTPGSGGTVDVTKAGVVFDIYTSTNLSMATPDATCTATVSSAGVATCIKSLGLDDWTVVAVIPGTNQYFTAPGSDPAVVSVYQPSTGTWVTGGGWVVDPSSTVSSSNRHGNFGFNVRYGTNNALKGQSVYTFRGANGYDYVVKSNSWNGGGFAVGTSTTGFSGKAAVTVIDPSTGLPVLGLGGGNYSFRVDATQGMAATKTSPATPSTYAISVYNGLGQLWHQAGTTASQLPLGGGNVVVHPK